MTNIVWLAAETLFCNCVSLWLWWCGSLCSQSEAVHHCYWSLHACQTTDLLWFCTEQQNIGRLCCYFLQFGWLRYNTCIRVFLCLCTIWIYFLHNVTVGPSHGRPCCVWAFDWSLCVIAVCTTIAIVVVSSLSIRLFVSFRLVTQKQKVTVNWNLVNMFSEVCQVLGETACCHFTRLQILAARELVTVVQNSTVSLTDFVNVLLNSWSMSDCFSFKLPGGCASCWWK